MSKVSVSRLSDADASALAIVAGRVCHVIANVTAIVVKETQTVVTLNRRADKAVKDTAAFNKKIAKTNETFILFISKLNQIVLIIYYRINGINTKL